MAKVDILIIGAGTDKYDIICLPLRILAGAGAPAHAILKPAAHDQVSII